MNDEGKWKHRFWGSIILIALIIILIIVLIIVNHPYEIVFNMNMDNNTLEAVKSINWSAIPK